LFEELLADESTRAGAGDVDRGLAGGQDRPRCSGRSRTRNTYPASATNGERHPSSWQTTSRATYDTLGRVATDTDTAGSTTTTTYTPVAAGPLTRTKVTNVKSQNVYTYADYARGLPTKVYDINNKITETTYDALGRQTATWLSNRSSASNYSPNYTYAYSVSNADNSWASTSTLMADGTTYNTSYAIYDSLLRPLQSQSDVLAAREKERREKAAATRHTPLSVDQARIVRLDSELNGPMPTRRPLTPQQQQHNLARLVAGLKAA